MISWKIIIAVALVAICLGIWIGCFLIWLAPNRVAIAVGAGLVALSGAALTLGKIRTTVTVVFVLIILAASSYIALAPSMVAAITIHNDTNTSITMYLIDARALICERVDLLPNQIIRKTVWKGDSPDKLAERIYLVLFMDQNDHLIRQVVIKGEDITDQQITASGRPLSLPKTLYGTKSDRVPAVEENRGR